MQNIFVVPESYTVWDLETTGLDYRKDRILEIAAMRVLNGKVVEEWSTLINHDIDIPAEASRIHGITKEMCAEKGIPITQAIDKLVDMIFDTKVCVTHNGMRFDSAFLLEEFNRHGIQINTFLVNMLEHHHLDMAVFYKAMKLGITREADECAKNFSERVMDIRAYGVKYNVGACCDDLGIDRTNVVQHRAGADVYLTNEIFKKLLLCP